MRRTSKKPPRAADRRVPLGWFGRAISAPPLTARQWRVLGVLGAANLIDSYDVALLGLALPQIQAGIGIADADIGGLMAFVRLGVVPAILLTILADRGGRRRLLLITIIGFTVCTCLTAFARTPYDFAVLQFLARVFIAGEGMLAIVVVTEEFDAGNRGWGIGMLGALGALGHGLASLIFSFVGVLPYGWRALYVLGVVPLLLLAWFRRSLSETQRFAQHAHARPHEPGSLWEPVRHLVRMYPGRMIALCAAVFPFAFVVETVMFFPSKVLQDVHGYTPANVAGMYLSVGVMALLGNIVAGALGDRFGRKRVLIGSITLNAVAAAVFYNAAGWWLPPMWGLMVMTLTMSLVLFGALGSELFPTSHRSTASGLRGVVATLGASSGLWLQGELYTRLGSHGAAITYMLVVMPIAPLIVALTLPETANRELEEVSPER